MVAPTWLLMSSPTIGRPASPKLLRPFGVGREEHGDAIDHRDAGVEAGLRVMLDGLLGADRQIAQQHLGARLAQSLGDVGRLEIGRAKGDVVVVVRHVRRHAIEVGTHLDDDVRHRQRTLEDPRVVRLGEDRLLQRPADLASIDVESGDELDVARAVAADCLAHDAVQRRVAAAPVIFHALHQRAGAIADTGDGDLDVASHALRNSPYVRIVGRLRRSREQRPAHCPSAFRRIYQQGGAAGKHI